LLKPLNIYETVTALERQTMLKEKQVIAQQLVNVIRAMRNVDAVSTADDSEDFTAGYIQALDDLLAWLEEDFDL
jgi:hypothetical protein